MNDKPSRGATRLGYLGLSASRSVAVIAVLVAASYVWTLPGVRWDFAYDWLVTRAVLMGFDPSLPLRELAPLMGLHTELSYAHPRLPGALIVQAPIGLLPWSWVYVAGRLMVVASTAAFLWILAHLVQWPREWFLAATPFVLLLPGFSSALRVGNTGLLVAALIGWTWLRGSGWGLGIATTLKVWPWLIIPALFLSGHRRTAYQAAGLFAGLNTVGLLLPHASVQGTVEVMAAAQVHAERSLTLFPLWLSLTLGMTFLFALWRLGWSPGWAIPVALATAPLLWSTYLPAAALAFRLDGPPAASDRAAGRRLRAEGG